MGTTTGRAVTFVRIERLEFPLPEGAVLECGGKVTDAHRLAHVPVHAGLQALLLALGRDIRGHGDDGGLIGGVRLGPDETSRFHSIHPGHPDIHEDDVIGRGMHGGDSIHTVVHHVCVIAEPVQHQQHDVLADLVVLDDEHPTVGETAHFESRVDGEARHVSSARHDLPAALIGSELALWLVILLRSSNPSASSHRVGEALRGFLVSVSDTCASDQSGVDPQNSGVGHLVLDGAQRRIPGCCVDAAQDFPKI